MTCEHTTTIAGERIFAVMSGGEYGITTGGMPEKELRAVLAILDRDSLGSDYDVIKAALDG